MTTSQSCTCTTTVSNIMLSQQDLIAMADLVNELQSIQTLIRMAREQFDEHIENGSKEHRVYLLLECYAACYNGTIDELQGIFKYKAGIDIEDSVI